MGAFPTLFISHGAPSLPIDGSPTAKFLAKLGERQRRPKAILIVSAHNLAPRPTLGAHPHPETIHDFHGFSDALYALRYPASGDPELAQAIATRITRAGVPADIDPQRGLDHGAWTPLMLLYPSADIPMVQLSLVRGESTRYHYRLGQALRGLGEEGVLIIGSGGISHNLRALDWGTRVPSTPAYDWVDAFTRWIAEQVQTGDVAALLDYRVRAPHAAQNHPSEEHLLPFFVAMGASASNHGKHVHAEVQMRGLAMDAYVFD